jgi:hypothetical protein
LEKKPLKSTYFSFLFSLSEKKFAAEKSTRVSSLQLYSRGEEELV